ncbi:MAG TPA: hypothetical protein VJZ71_16765 [Phycisphaerae bacterium]|nr:hypothetical protein [Phycisphaerae bacterium]
MFVLCVGLSAAIGAAFADGATSDHLSDLAGTLVTTAEVVGGAAGILFAVIVFGIQYHGEKLDKAAFLVRYLRRREGLIPIAAFTLGVVAANVVVSLICPLGLPRAAVPMAILDVPLVLLVLWLVLWLLHRMTTSVSDDFVMLLTPSLTWEYDRALDEDIHHARQRKVFEEAVEDAGMRYSTVGGFTSVDPVAPVKLSLDGRGSVVDVNLTALRLLGDHIRSVCPDHDAKLCIGPGDVVDNTVALVLSPSRDDQGRRKQDVVAPGEEVVEVIRKNLRAVFRLGSARRRDVVDVLSRFEDVLVSYSRHDSSEQLERGLEIQEALVKRGLARADAVAGQFSMHRERLPDFLAGFNFFNMAQHSVASGDREKVSALLTFSCRMMDLAVQHLHPGLYHRAGEIIVAVYYQAIEGTELADYVGDYLDNVVLMSLGAQFEYAHSSWRSDPPTIASQMPVLMVDLAWRLELMRAGLEAGRTKDAVNFQDRLFRWDEHTGRRFAVPHEESNVPPELREASDVMSYATLITAGWCLHLVETRSERTDAAKAVFQRCAADLGSREHLLRLWETVRSKPFTGRPPDDPFGVTRWTSPSVGRAGVTIAYGVSDAWIERGFMALMLARPSSPKYEAPDAMGACPPFRHKSPDEVKQVADSILANDSVRKELLNIADENRDETVNAVVALFAERLRLFKLDRLAAVVAAPLLDEHRVRLHAENAKELENDYGLRSTLAKLGGLQAESRAWFLPRIQYGVWLQKDSVVRCREHPMEFAPLIARSIQERENTRVTHAAERIATPTTTIHRLAELADAVRDAIARSRRTTKNPILVFLPHEHRLLEAIFGQRGWRLPSRRNLGDNHIGDWEGCHLLRFPYIDPSSVVIVDGLAFYGKIMESTDVRLNFDITNPHKATHDEVLRQAQSESDPTKIPDADTITVLATARYSADIGLHNPHAALRVDLDLTRIGFAMIKGENTYHRPDCTLLAGIEGGIMHTLAHRLPSENEPRTPCEHCRPNDWDE